MPEKIVVFAPNWLGDAVMALPALRAIRQHWPAATLIVAARPSVAPRFAMVPGVDEVVSLGAAGGWRSAGAWAADARALAGARAEVAILLPNSFRSALIARQAGIPERWGFATDLRGRLLTTRVPRPRGRMHQSEYYGALVAGLAEGAWPLFAKSATLLDPPVVARQQAEALLARAGVAPDAPLVGMAPGAAYGRAKQWPPERFARLAELLHERHGATAVLVGVRADRAAGELIEREMASGKGRAPSGLLNLIGHTDLPTLVALMSRCHAFVSNDSGAMHLAAAVGVAVTAIFGSTDEQGTAPLAGASATVAPHEILTCEVWCRPCMLRECPIDHRCMTGIDPVRVSEAVRRQLALRSGPDTGADTATPIDPGIEP